VLRLGAPGAARPAAADEKAAGVHAG
jgi:hypothetical protein